MKRERKAGTTSMIRPPSASSSSAGLSAADTKLNTSISRPPLQSRTNLIPAATTAARTTKSRTTSIKTKAIPSSTSSLPVNNENIHPNSSSSILSSHKISSSASSASSTSLLSSSSASTAASSANGSTSRSVASIPSYSELKRSEEAARLELEETRNASKRLEEEKRQLMETISLKETDIHLLRQQQLELQQAWEKERQAWQEQMKELCERKDRELKDLEERRIAMVNSQVEKYEAQTKEMSVLQARAQDYERKLVECGIDPFTLSPLDSGKEEAQRAKEAEEERSYWQGVELLERELDGKIQFMEGMLQDLRVEQQQQMSFAEIEKLMRKLEATDEASCASACSAPRGQTKEEEKEEKEEEWMEEQYDDCKRWLQQLEDELEEELVMEEGEVEDELNPLSEEDEDKEARKARRLTPHPSSLFTTATTSNE
ncbi:hypothetical protein QOT17_015012 [Balamuthia mandrillaris]